MYTHAKENNRESHLFSKLRLSPVQSNRLCYMIGIDFNH